MTTQTDKIAAAPSTARSTAPSTALPVATWGLLQLALLGIGASGFPLWAHQPLPQESLSLKVVFCGQILLTSMLFPILLRNGWALILNVALALPIDQLAGLLSHSSQSVILELWGVVAIWMTGLAGWAKLLTDYRFYPLLISVALLETAGACVMDYLRWEAQASTGSPSHFVPLSLLCRACDPGTANTVTTWCEAAIPALLISLIYLSSTLPSTLLHTGRKPPPTSLPTAK